MPPAPDGPEAHPGELEHLLPGQQVGADIGQQKEPQLMELLGQCDEPLHEPLVLHILPGQHEL